MIIATDPNQQPNEITTQPEHNKTAEKIHRHLLDKNDKISDEDIKNMRTDIPAENLDSPYNN